MKKDTSGDPFPPGLFILFGFEVLNCSTKGRGMKHFCAPAPVWHILFVGVVNGWAGLHLNLVVSFYDTVRRHGIMAWTGGNGEGRQGTAGSQAALP